MTFRKYRLKKVSRNLNRGFALLFAVLITSIMLAVGLAIFNITVKEIILSGEARESSAAFYAADSGVECALYWDVEPQDIFVSGAPEEGTIPPTSLTCFESILGVTSSSVDDNGRPKERIVREYQFAGKIDSAHDFCTAVRVQKTFELNYVPDEDNPGNYFYQDTTVIETIIEGRGRNTGFQAGSPADCDGPSARKVERGLRAEY
jgi:hypothetical protein